MGKYFIILIFLIFNFSCQSQKAGKLQLKVGAERMNLYLNDLKGKSIGIFANHTALVGQTHLTDTLLALGIDVKSVFSPEHGFKGNQPDGELITDQKAQRFELISLYGKDKYPKDEDITDLDLLIIDIQDVGVRCYTYASSMTYLMEVCATNDVPVLILDRPNPNGSYVDGPVLDEDFKSFVGLHPIPLVHGLTLGELAQMINGEGWLKDHLKCNLQVIPVQGWKHSNKYSLPVPPSPNLPNDQAVALYPSLVLFEGTVVSVGRGTDYPFQVIGHPKYSLGSYTFTPSPNAASKYPPLEGEHCYGMNLSSVPVGDSLNLQYLIGFYMNLKDKIEGSFFKDYFTKLAGMDQLQQQIEKGWSEKQIRESWREELDNYRVIREKYLLYED